MFHYFSLYKHIWTSGISFFFLVSELLTFAFVGFHVDDSEVTLNVCLGKQFSGGELYFRGIRCENHVNSETQHEVTPYLYFNNCLNMSFFFLFYLPMHGKSCTFDWFLLCCSYPDNSLFRPCWLIVCHT